MRTDCGIIIHDRCTPLQPSRPYDSFHLVKPKREAKEWTPPLDYKVTGFQLKIDEDTKEFTGQRITERTSVETVVLATDDFTEAWSATEYHRE
jgi:hypothetical protein